MSSWHFIRTTVAMRHLIGEPHPMAGALVYLALMATITLLAVALGAAR